MKMMMKMMRMTPLLQAEASCEFASYGQLRL
jgi:hypothetical protein